MPYGVYKSNGKFHVVKKSSGKIIGTHDSQEKAKKQIEAIYINEHKR